MSWDDIIIGEPKDRKSNSACGVDHEIRTVSHNKQSYWCDDSILGFGITLYKDTKEGEYLTKMLKDKVETKVIQGWIDRLILKKMTPSKLLPRIKSILHNEKQRSYESGREDKLKEIKKVLEINVF